MDVEERRVYNKAHYLKNKDKRKVQGKAYYEQNKEKVLCRTGRWKKNNPKQHAANVRKWQQANQEASNLIHKNRYARKKNAPGRWTADDITDRFKLQQGKCHYCFLPLGSSFHRDHAQPLSRGGTNHPENLRLACQRCNDSKGSKTEEEYLGYRSEYANDDALAIGQKGTRSWM